MKCYVGYLIDDEREDGVPVSADVDKDQAEGQAIKRVLGSGIIAGSIQVLERDLSEEELGTLKSELDGVFSARGLA